jgi:membrane-associated phospholipid phosphatase
MSKMNGNKLNRIKLLLADLGRKIRQYLGWQMLAGLIFAVGSLLLFLWLADEVFEGETKVFDETVRQAIHQWATPHLTQLMIFLSLTGSGIFLTTACVIVSIVFLRLKWKHAAALFWLTMTGELVLEVTLKLFFHRVRPEPFFNYPLPASFSFPSGHALGSFCFYIVLAWLITVRIKNRGLKILIWILAAMLVFVIGISRIYLGVHFPSDVLAGFTAAFVWILTIALSDYIFGKQNSENY